MPLYISISELQCLQQDAMQTHDEGLQIMPTTEGAAEQLRVAADRVLKLYAAYLLITADEIREQPGEPGVLGIQVAGARQSIAEAAVREAQHSYVTALRHDAAVRVELWKNARAMRQCNPSQGAGKAESSGH